MAATQERKLADHGDMTAKLWLMLLKSGGRWSSWDLAKAAGESATNVSQLLSAMSRSGQVKQYPTQFRRAFCYGVTSECKVPRMATVGKIAECLAGEAA